MDTNQIKAPKHLRAATKRWWLSVATGYELEEHHLKLLTLAAEAWDRCVQAREALADHGLTYKDRFGRPRARPEVAVERDGRIALARLLRELALDVNEPSDECPPPFRRTRFEARGDGQTVSTQRHPELGGILFALP